MGPIDMGGLGSGSLRAMNLALLCKWRWKAKVDSNSLWFKYIKALHHDKRMFSPLPLNPLILGTWKNIISINKDLPFPLIFVRVYMAFLARATNLVSEMIFGLETPLLEINFLLFLNLLAQWIISFKTATLGLMVTLSGTLPAKDLQAQLRNTTNGIYAICF